MSQRKTKAHRQNKDCSARLPSSGVEEAIKEVNVLLTDSVFHSTDRGGSQGRMGLCEALGSVERPDGSVEIAECDHDRIERTIEAILVNKILLFAHCIV